MRNLILQECQAQSLVPFLTPGTENFSDVVWKSPDAVHALLPPCFVYKKTAVESWYKYFTLTIKEQRDAWITGFTVAWVNSSLKMLAHSWETPPKRFLYPKTFKNGCFSSKLLWNKKLWQSFWVVFYEVFSTPNTISTTSKSRMMKLIQKPTSWKNVHIEYIYYFTGL